MHDSDAVADAEEEGGALLDDVGSGVPDTTPMGISQQYANEYWLVHARSLMVPCGRICTHDSVPP